MFYPALPAGWNRPAGKVSILFGRLDHNLGGAAIYLRAIRL